MSRYFVIVTREVAKVELLTGQSVSELLNMLFVRAFGQRLILFFQRIGDGPPI